MPRTLELTFQKGTNGRTGRWKKFYHGKTRYLGSGRCKSDIESYKIALAAWRTLKIKLDGEVAAAPRPLAKEYADVIAEWELVLSWSVGNGADDEAAIARAKLAELQSRREQVKPPPVDDKDRIWSRFRPDKKVLKEISDLATRLTQQLDWDELRNAMLERGANRTIKRDARADDIDVSPLRKAEIQWEDRIESQKRLAVGEVDHTLGGWVTVFLTKQQQRVHAGDLSAGRYASGQATLKHFRDWAGAQVAVSSISGKTLSGFHTYQLERIATGKCASGYARDHMICVRAFVRWLWGQDAIENLPKNIDSKELNIARRVTTPKTLEISEVKKVLQASSGRTRLYILLGLNCGMTQKDISDLKQTDVAWADGTITRKRSKTQRHKGVPTVTYRLWPETIELLREFRSDTDVVLLNRNGNRLLQEYLEQDGSYRKSDNIRNAYARALRKVSFSKPFKLLRKTSATLINADARFRGLDELFLGHAAKTIAEKHYTATSRSALDDALAFLRMKYEINNIDDTVAES